MGWKQFKEAVNDGAKNVITFGKHAKIKTVAQKHADNLALLRELHRQGETLIIHVTEALRSLEVKKQQAAAACRECCAAVVQQGPALAFTPPALKPPPPNKLDAHLGGVLDSELQAAYKANKVGATATMFGRYIATNKDMQKQVIKHPMIAAGVLLIEGVVGLVSATEAATKQLMEVVAIEEESNDYVIRYRQANATLTALHMTLRQDTGALDNQVSTLYTLKDALLGLHGWIYQSPSRWRLFTRFFRKLFRMNIYSAGELNALSLCCASFNQCVENINLLLQKQYEL